MSAARRWAAASGLLKVAGVLVLLVLECLGQSRAAMAVDRRLGAQIAKPAATGAAWSADATSRLDRDIDLLLDAAPTLRGAHVGLLVIDTRSGRVLYARNADDAFQPASTLKLLTGSVALTNLGPSYRFRTTGLLDPAGSTLVIHAGGDPLLRAADLDLMAQAVRAGGVTALASGVRVDASEFEAAAYPPGWSWDDLVYDYAPALSAATIEENVVHLAVAPGPTAGAPVAVSAAPVSVSIAPFGLADRAPDPDCAAPFAIVVSVLATTAPHAAPNTLDLARTRGGCIEITGAVAAGAEPQTLDAAVPNPIWYLHAVAQSALIRAGIDVPDADSRAADSSAAGVSTGAARTAGVPTSTDLASSVSAGSRVVWTHDGEPLSDLLADLWWPSDNLIAELLLKAIGRQDRGVPGTTEHGADAERAWLARIGIDPATVTLIDGSGLSTYDRLTPRALGAILQADWNGPFRELVLDDLPLAGVRGTLEKSFAGSLAAGRTFAKTGSFNHTRGVAGYLATLHHGAVTFAWSVDDWMGDDADLNALRARVLSRLIGD